MRHFLPLAGTTVLVMITLLGNGNAGSAAAPATAPATQPAAVPAEWQSVTVANRFGMRLPVDVKEQAVQGVDSLVRSYRGAGLALDCDYGWYSDPLKYADKAKFERKEVAVGGKNAVLVTFEEEKADDGFPLRAGIHFPNVTGDGKVKLTIFVRCRDAEAQKTAKLVLQSVTFP